MTGRVTLVGAGPGDPGLITVRGLECLRSADVVIYDRLIDAQLLVEAPTYCERIDAGKAPGDHRLSQQQINELLVARAGSGLQVVRLKGGDPFLYGRGWEEWEACQLAGIPCEVVPGVSSALAVPAAAGIPITARGMARTVTITTLQDSEGLPTNSVNFKSLAAADTLSVLMSRGRLRELCNGLMQAGRAIETPAAVIERGTLPGQRVVNGTLGTIADIADQEEITNPAVILVGQVAALATPRLENPQGRTLVNRRIVVTRPRTASRDLVRELVHRGARVIEAPLIEVLERPPTYWPDLASYEWIVFTSLHGVRGFVAALEARRLDARALASARLAAVGPKTAAELRRLGLFADLVPGEHRAAALVEELASRLLPGTRALFPCGTLALDVIPKGLGAHGIVVESMDVYETRLRPILKNERADIEAGVDAILLYSPSAVRSLVESGACLGEARIAAIGPTTAEAARQLGLNVHIVPDQYGDRGMIRALEHEFAEQQICGQVG